MRASRALRVASIWSMRSKWSRAVYAWWSVKRPVRASTRAADLRPMEAFASEAKVCVSRSPDMRASRILRADRVLSVLTTEDNLMLESSSPFSSRDYSPVRS